jgi:hypothetical protein
MSPLVAHHVDPLWCQRLDAVGGEADMPRALRACRSDENDPSLPLAANFAVMHNAAFLIRTKASFVTPSTAKSLPSGSSKWLVMASAIPMKRVRERRGRSASSNRQIAEFLYCSWF